jgi:hypothetical protein
MPWALPDLPLYRRWSLGLQGIDAIWAATLLDMGSKIPVGRFLPLLGPTGPDPASGLIKPGGPPLSHGPVNSP